MGPKEDIYDSFNYIKVEWPVFVVLKRLKHNLLEVLFKGIDENHKKNEFEQDDFLGPPKVWILVFRGQDIKLDHYPPNSNVTEVSLYF